MKVELVGDYSSLTCLVDSRLIRALLDNSLLVGVGLRALLLVAANIFGVGGVTRRTGKTYTIGDGGSTLNPREKADRFKVIH